MGYVLDDAMELAPCFEYIILFHHSVVEESHHDTWRDEPPQKIYQSINVCIQC